MYFAQSVAAQLTGRTFARALKQDYVVRQAAAASRTSSILTHAEGGVTRARLGPSLEEATGVVNKDLVKEEVVRNYGQFIKNSDKTKGGFFGLQPKTPAVFGLVQSRVYCTTITSQRLEEAVSEANLRRCVDDLKDFWFRKKSKEAHKKSAVLVCFCRDRNNEPSLLVTLRPTTIRFQKWTICFPGGKESPEDEGDVVKIALRETEEEVGIKADQLHIIGALNPVRMRMREDGYVYGVVAVAKSDLSDESLLNINHHEVEKVFFVPLRHLLCANNWRFTEWKGGMVSPVYSDEIFNGRTAPKIWGLTAGITYVLLSRLMPDCYGQTNPK